MPTPAAPASHGRWRGVASRAAEVVRKSPVKLDVQGIVGVGEDGEMETNYQIGLSLDDGGASEADGRAVPRRSMGMTAVGLGLLALVWLISTRAVEIPIVRTILATIAAGIAGLGLVVATVALVIALIVRRPLRTAMVGGAISAVVLLLGLLVVRNSGITVPSLPHLPRPPQTAEAGTDPLQSEARARRILIGPDADPRPEPLGSAFSPLPPLSPGEEVVVDDRRVQEGVWMVKREEDIPEYMAARAQIVARVVMIPDSYEDRARLSDEGRILGQLGTFTDARYLGSGAGESSLWCEVELTGGNYEHQRGWVPKMFVRRPIPSQSSPPPPDSASSSAPEGQWVGMSEVNGYSVTLLSYEGGSVMNRSSGDRLDVTLGQHEVGIDQVSGKLTFDGKEVGVVAKGDKLIVDARDRLFVNGKQRAAGESRPGPPARSSLPPVRVGEEGILDRYLIRPWMADSRGEYRALMAELDAVNKAGSEGKTLDESATRLLAEAERSKLVPNGTRVRVLRVEPDGLEIEMLDGASAGRTGWVLPYTFKPKK